MGKIVRDFKAGETLQFSLQYDGVDITGWTFTFILRADLTALTNDLEFSTTVGTHADDDATNGYVVIEVPFATTATLTSGKYYYQLMSYDGTKKDIIAPVGCTDTLNVCQSLEV